MSGYLDFCFQVARAAGITMPNTQHRGSAGMACEAFGDRVSPHWGSLSARPLSTSS